MNSLQWFDQVTSSDTANQVSVRSNVTGSTLSRQMKRGELSPEVVVAIARAYDAPILPALVACGLITEEEAALKAPLGKLLSEATNRELLLELMRRDERGKDDDVVA